MPSNRIEMNYLKAYCKLVRKEEAKGLTKKEAKKQGLYVEGHHVFPCSLYGKTNEGNRRIVYVSARVHYILHALLEKAFIKRYGLEHPNTLKMTSAHVMMKGYEYNEKYVNSIIYENTRKRLAKLLTGKKRPKHVSERMSKSMKGKYIGRNNPSVVTLKVYFEDGRVIEYLDGIRNFCKEYGYPQSSIEAFIYRNRKKYRDIIKIEKYKLEKPKAPKVYNQIKKGRVHSYTIPIRIYFADGRIEECIDGTGDFCRRNPKYSSSHISSMRRGERSLCKDIVKVEDMRIHKEASKPIVKKYYNKNYIPLKLYFEDGRVIIAEKGAGGFCKENPEYERRSITRVGLGKNKRHKDIIKVERLVDYKNP